MKKGNIQYFGKTDVGLMREANEDAFLVMPENGLFAVFDGMGGHAAGNIASCIASTIVSMLFRDKNGSGGLMEKTGFGEMNGRDFLVSVIQTANRSLYNLACKYTALRGMGTTVAACLVEKNVIHIAHVGDSRIYRVRNGNLHAMTVDHSWVNEMLEDREITKEEAEKFRRRNIITRVLGIRPVVKVDVKTEIIKKNDAFLICSDGLTSLVEEKKIEIVVNASSLNIEEKCQRLIELANSRGGDDNVTVLLIKADEADAAGSEYSSEIGKTKIVGEEDKKKLAKEDRIFKKAVNEIDFSPFGRDLFKHKQFATKRMVITALVILLLPFVIYFAVDIAKTPKVKEILNKLKSGFSSKKNDDIVVKSKDNKSRNEIVEELKSMIPDSKHLEIDKNRIRK